MKKIPVTPDVSTALRRLGQLDAMIDQIAVDYVPSAEFAGEILSRTRERARINEIAEVAERFGPSSSRVGHLVAEVLVNRDAQMATLAKLGKDVLLSVISNGLLPSQVAEELALSYDTLNEFLQLTCTREELERAQSLAADALVGKGLSALNEASSASETSRARALAEFNLKIARLLNHDWRDVPTGTEVQINNYSEGAVPYIRVVSASPETLPALKAHQFTTEDPVVKGEGLVIDGSYTPFGPS